MEWLKREKEEDKKTLSPQFQNYISVRAEISIKASARYYKVNFLAFEHAWGCYQLCYTVSLCFFNANGTCDNELTARMEDYHRSENWFESIWSVSFSPGTWSKQSPCRCLNNFPSVSHPYLLGLEYRHQRFLALERLCSLCHVLAGPMHTRGAVSSNTWSRLVTKWLTHMQEPAVIKLLCSHIHLGLKR